MIRDVMQWMESVSIWTWLAFAVASVVVGALVFYRDNRHVTHDEMLAARRERARREASREVDRQAKAAKRAYRR